MLQSKEFAMYKSKMMIVMRRDLKMRKGKIAAQAGHACIDAILMALNKQGRLNDFEMTSEGISLKNTETELQMPWQEISRLLLKEPHPALPFRECEGNPHRR